MNNVREIWENQSNSAGSDAIIRHRINEVVHLNCFIGTIRFSQAKVFLLELDKNTQVQNNYLKRFAGVEIQVLPSGADKNELVIILMENTLTDIFCYFIEDIITALIPVNSQSNALNTISLKISYWRKLFSKITGDLLTPQQQRGLFGELYFLRELLHIREDKLAIIYGWQAPDGANQDFYYDEVAIEIKTTRSNKPSIKISNEYQLDDAGLRRLFLAFYKLNEYPGNLSSLFGLITEIRQMLNNDHNSLSAFNEKLESLGVNSEIEEEYNNPSYSIGFEKYYRVTPEFPKITRESIHKAVSGVSYEIAPNECIEFEESLSTILNHIGKYGSN